MRLVEEDVTEPAADHDAEKGGPGNKVAHLRLGQIGVAFAREPGKEREAAEKREHIGHPVPAGPERFRDVEDERIKLMQVVSERGHKRMPYRSKGCSRPAGECGEATAACAQ